MAKEKDQAALEQTIIAEWKAFANTSAYKDWILSMNQTMELIQNNVDNMTESRPGGDVVAIDNDRSTALNQRKVGIKYSTQYAQLRIDA